MTPCQCVTAQAFARRESLAPLLSAVVHLGRAPRAVRPRSFRSPTNSPSAQCQLPRPRPARGYQYRPFAEFPAPVTPCCDLHLRNATNPPAPKPPSGSYAATGPPAQPAALCAPGTRDWHRRGAKRTRLSSSRARTPTHFGWVTSASRRFPMEPCRRIFTTYFAIPPTRRRTVC